MALCDTDDVSPAAVADFLSSLDNADDKLLSTMFNTLAGHFGNEAAIDWLLAHGARIQDWHGGAVCSMTLKKLVSLFDDAGLATLDRWRLARSAALSLPPDVDFAAQLIDRVPDLPLAEMIDAVCISSCSVPMLQMLVERADDATLRRDRL